MTPRSPRWLLLGAVVMAVALALLLRALGAPEAPGPRGWFARWALPLAGTMFAAAALAAWSAHRSARLLAGVAVLLCVLYALLHLTR